MSTITTNPHRIGNFTSSEIVKLLAEPTAAKKKEGEIFGAPAYNYIEECNMERRLGRSIETEENARNLSWGKLCELYISQNPILLSLEYKVNLSDTSVHPDIDYWAGSEDALTEDAVCDFKSPRTLKSFCQLVDAVAVHGLQGTEAMNYIRQNHKDGDKYYWQLVSNACIHNKQFAELIVFVPYLSQLNELRELAGNWDNPEESFKYSWIFNANDEELPYLVDGGFYKNINVIRFEIPQSDKDYLKERVLLAGKLLADHKVMF